MSYGIRSALITIAVATLLGSGAALAQSNACKADLNGDLVVNFADLAVLKSVFFQSCPRFEDRGETVFDHQTGLEWEKKTDDGSIHDKDNVYRWSIGVIKPDGDAFTVFLAGLNGGDGECVTLSDDGQTLSSPAGYGGHCDWRLPTIVELRTIVDCSHGAPCVDPIFGPTQPFSSIYWSSSISGASDETWWIDLHDGTVRLWPLQISSFGVRAVRGGL